MKSKQDILKLRTASKEEVSSKILDLKKELMNLRFQHTTGSLKDSSLLRKTKKAIATLKSFLTNNVDVIGIKKINPLYPDCSVFKKQVIIGLRPITSNIIATPKNNNVIIIEINKYFLIFLPGFKIPSIEFKLIFLK